jgi:hypothetical protein
VFEAVASSPHPVPFAELARSARGHIAARAIPSTVALLKGRGGPLARQVKLQFCEDAGHAAEGLRHGIAAAHARAGLIQEVEIDPEVHKLAAELREGARHGREEVQGDRPGQAPQHAPL